MEWLMPGWVYWLAVGTGPAPPIWAHDEVTPTARTDGERRRELTVLDLALIQLVYGVVAAESTCSRCGAPLGSALRVMHSALDNTPWTVSIVARCSGWRRHRHIAVVDETANDLVLGPFSAVWQPT
jgi:hypothetical protein